MTVRCQALRVKGRMSLSGKGTASFGHRSDRCGQPVDDDSRDLNRMRKKSARGGIRGSGIARSPRLSAVGPSTDGGVRLQCMASTMDDQDTFLYAHVFDQLT